MTVNTALDAKHLYACGNSGTGKSANIKVKLSHCERAIIFDPDDEYHTEKGVIRVESPNQLIALLKANANSSLKVAFVAEGLKAFEFWANAAFAWKNCLAIAEEIADVTTAAKAPPCWGKLIRRGRKYGITICAVTQRPAEADKTILSNAAFIRTGALGRLNDRQAVAKEIDIHYDEIARLKPLDWIEFNRADLSVTGGRLGTTAIYDYNRESKAFELRQKETKTHQEKPKAVKKTRKKTPLKK
ncbi:ATP-binding protein [Thalassotalea piscium]|uniref:ATP-binding protein n=1 Tax=Thalassotalea piscium TaxID=1230533 RepID=A0A7X0NG55_9GAMM|nr:ATP-binding protein [Thalassotalea piscium]MBB6542861.1 hypothetical protein [Thalassotalea piscium]